VLTIAKSESASDLHLAAGKGDLKHRDNYEPLTAEEVRAAFIQIVTPDRLEKFQKDHVNLRW